MPLGSATAWKRTMGMPSCSMLCACNKKNTCVVNESQQQTQRPAETPAVVVTEKRYRSNGATPAEEAAVAHHGAPADVHVVAHPVQGDGRGGLGCDAGNLLDLVLVVGKHFRRQLLAHYQPLEGQLLLGHPVHGSAEGHQLFLGREPMSGSHLQVSIVHETATCHLNTGWKKKRESRTPF